MITKNGTKYEIVNFNGVWLEVLRADGTWLVDPTHIDEFIKLY